MLVISLLNFTKIKIKGYKLLKICHLHINKVCQSYYIVCPVNVRGPRGSNLKYNCGPILTKLKIKGHTLTIK